MTPQRQLRELFHADAIVLVAQAGKGHKESLEEAADLIAGSAKAPIQFVLVINA